MARGAAAGRISVRRYRRLSAAALMALAGLAFSSAVPNQPAVAQSGSFAGWLTEVSREARGQSISQRTLDLAFSGLTPDPRVIELDNRQPEFTRTFWQYLDNAISEQRVANGLDAMVEHAALLNRIEAEYDVQPRFIVALWGLETGYGSFMGDFPVVRSLATLGYEGRRSDLFRTQLLDALRLVDRGDVAPAAMRGSWAGAVGHVQFMPSTYLRYAVDFDGDGRRDLWRSIPDAMASAANYLSSIGWRGDEIWGREVRLPPGFPYETADLAVERPLAEWRALGVRRIDGGDLPVVADMTGSIVLPMGHRGPAFLVYDNYRAIMQWNRSTLYAVAVGHLADRLAGQGPLQGPRPALGPPLTSNEVMELQRLLNARGFDSGTPDGRAGPLTRSALRSFQSTNGLPADGYPSRDMLERLRQAAARP